MSIQTNFKVGDDVRWLDNPFTIEEIKNNKALLRQRFSIGICLKDFVLLSEIELETTYESKQREKRLKDLLG